MKNRMLQIMLVIVMMCASFQPVYTVGKTSVENISSNGFFTAIVLNDGSLWTVRRNSFRTIGIGKKDSKNSILSLSKRMDNVKV